MIWASGVVLVAKNPPASAGDVRNMLSIPGLRISPGGRHENPLQYSCLENPMDRGAWRPVVHGDAKSRRWLKQLSTHTHTCYTLGLVWSVILATWPLEEWVFGIPALGIQNCESLHHREKVDLGRRDYPRFLLWVNNELRNEKSVELYMATSCISWCPLSGPWHRAMLGCVKLNF